jgi:hypothetical protein
MSSRRISTGDDHERDAGSPQGSRFLVGANAD